MNARFALKLAVPALAITAIAGSCPPALPGPPSSLNISACNGTKPCFLTM